MSLGEWSAVEAFFAEKLLADQQSASDAVVQTCKAYPYVSIHYIALSLSSAASALKSEWTAGTRSDLVRLLSLHEAIIGLMIDLAALELSDRRAETCSDLLEFWEAESDPLFRVS